ncbi:MAG: chloride channel protein [Bacteroidia bacterium]
MIRLLERGVDELHNLLNGKQFLILSSILVGLSAGLAAVVLKLFVFAIRRYLIEDFLLQLNFKYIYLLLPLIGIGITILITQRFFKGKLNRGTSNILFSIVRKSSILPFRGIYSHIVTSGTTVGFGGSAGLESPIVSTGSAIGSNYAQRYKLSYKDRTLLLAAGAAGGIAGAFNAPVAGILFALEVLLVDVNITAFIPLLIASASGALISKILLGEQILLNFRLKQPFDYHNVPFYVTLGLITGVISLYYVTLFDKIERRVKKWKSLYRRWLLGGLMLITLIAVFPPLFGEGYDNIKHLADNELQYLYKDSIFHEVIKGPFLILLFLLGTMILKVFAVGITLGSGGNGGNFAPSLFVGAYLGFIFASCLSLMGFEHVPVVNITLVAMAGVLTGVFHAPLTGIFLIAEITQGYELMIPLMLVSAISYVVVKYFHPESLDVHKLKKRGTVVSEDKDISILGKIELKDLIERDFTTVRPNALLGDIVNAIKQSRRNTFPVVGKNGILQGIIYLDEIREEIFDQKLYTEVSVMQLMNKPPEKIDLKEDIFSVMKKFDESGQWNLPVTDDGVYIGFLSKSSILSKYRTELLDSL